jgi:hypothetical protein
MKNALKKEPYITEEEFNRIVIARNASQPEEDSKGDSAIDETVEAELGENFSKEEGSENVDNLDEIEEEDRGYTTTDADREKIDARTSDQSRDRSSTWPDPADISK